MASIFKPKKRCSKHDAYIIEFTDHKGQRRRRAGFTDKRLSEQKGAQLEREAQLRRDGLIDPEEEKRAEQKTLPIIKHLAAYETSLGRNSSKYVSLTMSRIKRVVKSACIETLADIDEESVENAIVEIQEEDDLANRTVNHYMDAIDGFCRWLVPKRLLANPLVGLERLNAEVDIRRKRRALSTSEISSLLQSARESEETIQCYTGEERARIYLFAYLTGLRRSEMGSLTKRSFKLKSEPPTVTVEAINSKHRRKDVLPLHPQLVMMLGEWLKELKSDEFLFPKLEKRRTWKMVKLDLERTGIPYRTHEGVADFHAAGRHSHITGLLENGVSLAEAKELARHCDVRMTMKYTHIGIGSQAKALSSLPSPRMDEKTPYSELDSISVRPSSHSRTNDDVDGHKEATKEKKVSDVGASGYVTHCNEEANDGTLNALETPVGSIPAASTFCQLVPLPAADCQMTPNSFLWKGFGVFLCTLVSAACCQQLPHLAHPRRSQWRQYGDTRLQTPLREAAG